MSASAMVAPAHPLPDERDWKWAGWEWDCRAMHWLPSWKNHVLDAKCVEGSGHFRVTGRHRAFGTGETFQEAWRVMVSREDDCRKRRERRSHRTAPAPWAHILGGWTRDKRCGSAFAVSDTGSVVHHDDPTAARWCLAGWIAHQCMREGGSWTHGVRGPDWWELSDDAAARRELEFMWERIPTLHREFTTRVWKERVKARDRKRLDQHPLGYWWYIAPSLAAKFLGIEP